MIWEQLCAGQVFHPTANIKHSSYNSKRSYIWQHFTPTDCQVTYALCQRPDALQSEYCMLRGLGEDDADCDHFDCPPTLPSPLALIPPVCRQLRDEATAVTWSTSTFYFVSSGDFQAFLYDPYVPLHLVRNIAIDLVGVPVPGLHQHYAGEPDPMGWRRAWKSPQLAKLTSLPGLRLNLQYYRDLHNRDRCYDIDSPEYALHGKFELDVMNKPPWEFRDLPPCIRQLRQLPLDARYTSVFVRGVATDDYAVSGRNVGTEEEDLPSPTPNEIALGQAIKAALCQKKDKKQQQLTQPTQGIRRSERQGIEAVVVWLKVPPYRALWVQVSLRKAYTKGLSASDLGI
jgi:hypothetical protein